MDLTFSDFSNLMEKWHAGKNPPSVATPMPPRGSLPMDLPETLRACHSACLTERSQVASLLSLPLGPVDSVLISSPRWLSSVMIPCSNWLFSTTKPWNCTHDWLLYSFSAQGGEYNIFLLPFRLPELPIPSDLCSFWLRTNSKKRSFKLCSNSRSENCWTTNPFLNAKKTDPGFSPLLFGSSKGLSRFWVDALGESARPGGKSRGRFTSKRKQNSRHFCQMRPNSFGIMKVPLAICCCVFFRYIQRVTISHLNLDCCLCSWIQIQGAKPPWCHGVSESFFGFTMPEAQWLMSWP